MIINTCVWNLVHMTNIWDSVYLDLFMKKTTIHFMVWLSGELLAISQLVSFLLSLFLFHFSFEKQREHSQFCQPVLAWEENRRSSNLALPLSAISILPCHPMITYDDLPLFRLMTYMEEHGPPPPPHWNLHQTKIQGNEIMIYMKIKCLF